MSERKPSISDRIFDGMTAESELESDLDDAGAEYERLDFDHYDLSVELYDVPPDHRLPEAAQRVLFDAGFLKAFVNHTDKWETHYSFFTAIPGRVNEPWEFRHQDGWRIHKPHKRRHAPDPEKDDL